MDRKTGSDHKGCTKEVTDYILTSSHNKGNKADDVQRHLGKKCDTVQTFLMYIIFKKIKGKNV